MDGTRPIPLHASQRTPLRRFSAARHHRWGVFFLCLFVVLGCGGYFLYSALAAPRRSALIILSANYTPAWDLNPWSQENASLLYQLDRRSLNVVSGGNGTDIANGQWTNLDEQILASTSNRSNMPLLLYINLHGAVNDAGLPCLIPSSEDNTDPRTWIGVLELLQHVGELLNNRNCSVVLLFESGRQSEHVPVASGPTSFATAMQQLLESQGDQLLLKNLHVLLSSADNQDTVTDWTLGCDLFTRELARGLYGAADRIDHGGNQNGYVQFSELSNFVAEQVTRWSKRHRNTCQSVWAWSRSDANTPLVWKLTGDFKLPEPLPPAAGQDIDQLQRAWQLWAELHENSPWDEFPGQWQALSNHVIGLEQAVYGGQAARAHVPNLVDSIAQRTDWLKRQLKMHQEAHTIEQRVASAQSAVWKSLAESPTLITAQQLVNQFSSDGSENFATIPVLQLLAQNSSHPCWTDALDLQRYARLRHATALLQATPGHYELAQHLPQWERLQKTETRLDDSLLAEIDTTEINALLDDYELALNAWRDITLSCQQHVETRNKVIACLPIVAECVLSVARIPLLETNGESESSDYQQLEDQLVLLCLTTAKWCDFVATGQTAETAANLPNLQRLLLSLFDRQTRITSQLLSADLQPSSADLARLQCLLNHPWFPSTTPAPQLGELRSHAWIRMREWEHLLDVADLPQAKPLESEFSSGLVQQPKHEFSRLLAACITGKSRTSSLSPIELRTWLNRVQPAASSLSAEELTLASLSYWHRADLESRLTASLAGTEDGSMATTIYHELSTAHRLLTYAEETLRNFWATPDPARPHYFQWLANQALREAQILETRIFEISANSNLDAVATLSPPVADPVRSSDTPLVTSTLSPDAQSLRQRHQQLAIIMRSREAAARNGLRTVSRWLPDLDSSLLQPGSALNWILEVEVQAGADSTALPAGIAAIAVTGDNHSARQALELNSHFDGVQIPIATNWSELTANANDSNLEASVLFRGHVFRGSSPQLPTVGRSVRAEVSRNSSTNLTIFDQSPGQQRRTFILDCSASMVEATAGEDTVNGQAIDGASKLNKLESAKLALLDLLRHLRNEGDQVSVLLYGHRIAQGTAEQGTLHQTKYLEKFPLAEPVEAYEDVETILPMGRFGEAEFELVAERLAAVVPWGQTPLYLALAQSLQTTSRQTNPSDDQAHDIVIISDGRNYQFNPAPDKRIEAEQVIEQAQAQQARVHVIGFGVPANQAADSYRQFEQLAQGTGGTATMQVADASLLSQRLNELNAPQTYRVLLVDGSRLTGRANEPLTLPTPVSPNEQMAIEYRGRSYFVPLNPGTSLSMNVDARGNLVTINSHEGSLQFEKLLDAARQPTDTWVALARPQRLATNLQWQLSLRDRAAQATPRPHRVLVELLPQSKQPSGQPTLTPYIVVLNNWSSDTPHPTLKFTTTDWPLAADAARINVWVEQQAVPVDHDLQMEVGSLHWQPKPGLEVRMHLALDHLTCVVAGQSGEKVTDWCLALEDRSLVAITCCVNEQSNTNLYHFELTQAVSFPPKLKLDPRNSSRSEPTIELVSINEFKKRARMLAQPIQVDLVQPQTALAPTATRR